MKHIIVGLALIAAACSGSNNDTNNGTNNAATNASTGDMGSSDASNNGGPDVGADMSGTNAATNGTDSFCARADCTPERPQCSELLQRCVECTANSDCTTAPTFTCETMGDGMGGDPLYECVECVDDSVCAGGTCDLATHTCM